MSDIIFYSDEELINKTDEELFSILAKDDERLTSILISKYLGHICKKASSFAKITIDAQDLVQEGLLGLLNAISAFNNKNIKFATFADVCITNKMKSLIIKNNKYAIPLENIEDAAFMEEKINTESPESILIEKETLNELYNQLDKSLSKREWKVLNLYIKGSSYEQMSHQLNVSVKSIDNTMQRIRRKLKLVWKAEYFKLKR